MAGNGSDAALPYHEPSIATLLNLTGFLLALNLVNACLDKLLYCGLIGQLFIGILWGTPGAKWLDRGVETVIQQLGYIGLIMLVYEGGLSTSIKSVRSNLRISLCVAFTGIGVPMGLSFILVKMVSASSLQAFAAGAALSATSLGTTFTILSTTGLIATRIGTVMTSAAMLDDVVGLVMVQIISNFGSGTSSFTVVTVIRPVFVSIGFAVGLFILCAFCLKPVLIRALSSDNWPKFMGSMQFAFLAHTCVLVGIVAAATYAGTSSLFAAYLAGVIISWFDGLATDLKASAAIEASANPDSDSGVSDEQSSERETRRQSRLCSTDSQTSTSSQVQTGEIVYEKYYKAPVSRILIPLFFASIGFAIPITEMFQGSVVWRGVIYALLMTLGKMVTGLWLVRVSLGPMSTLVSTIRKPFSFLRFFGVDAKSDIKEKQKTPQNHSHLANQPSHNTGAGETDETKDSPRDAQSQSASRTVSQSSSSNRGNTLSLPPKPKSLYPPSILGLAMVARGEVGYLIASLAESQRIFSSGSNAETSEIYLVAIWAISICTLIGPISVGTLVKRVKKLQQSRDGSGADPLGAWGI